VCGGAWWRPEAESRAHQILPLVCGEAYRFFGSGKRNGPYQSTRVVVRVLTSACLSAFFLFFMNFNLMPFFNHITSFLRSLLLCPSNSSLSLIFFQFYVHKEPGLVFWATGYEFILTQARSSLKKKN
jgi:hypothetical protein